MCKQCDRIEQLQLELALVEIGKLMESGRNAEHFKPLLDKLLGIQEPETDTELDMAWQKENKN